MFCKKCGTQINGNVKFCPKCGTQVTAAHGGQQTYYQPEQNSTSGLAVGQDKRKVPYFAIAAIVILVIVVAFVLRSCIAGNDYKAPINSLIKGIEKRDGKMIMEAFSDEMLELLAEEAGCDRDQLPEELEAIFDYQIGDVNLSDIDYKVDYEIREELELSEREIKDIEEEMEEEEIYVEIEAGKEVDLTMIISVESRDSVENRDMTFEVIKIDGKWYINLFSM